MTNLKTAPSNWEANNIKNSTRLGFWTAAWVLTMAVATFGPKFVWHFNDAFSILAILVNVGIGFGMILANKRHLRGLDEMHQKIQLEAMALALGVALVVGLGYSTLDIANVITFDAEISHVVMLVGIVYGGGIFFGLRKYR